MTEPASLLSTASGRARLVQCLRQSSLDELQDLGYRVWDTLAGVDDAILLHPNGEPVETWREAYPYDELLGRDEYEEAKRALQIELLKAQDHLRASGKRLIVVFEGRDAAGKGGAIKRFTEHLNPRFARVVALSIPSEVEQGQWYFQRYVAHLPTRGEMVLFDRSWYNRGVVEPVMGYCDDQEYDQFMSQVPDFERMLTNSGIKLVKLWFSVSPSEQLTRFMVRRLDPVRQWKLSPVDIASLDKWDQYTRAKEAMFTRSHTDHAPWTVIQANDKKRGRLEAMRHVLGQISYEGKDDGVVGQTDPRIVNTPD